MQIHCRCGQPFTIHDVPFPHKVSCHVCGRHFNILDNGDRVDLDDLDPVALPSSALVATAVQTEPVLSIQRTAETAICTDDANGLFADTSAETKLQADLKLIDLSWNTKRDRYSLVPCFGIKIMPSKMMSLAVVLGLALGWSFMFALAITTTRQVWLCPGIIGVALTTFLPIYIYRKAHAYEKAEADWQRKRVLAIAQPGLAASDC